jgi:hypothetical protein
MEADMTTMRRISTLALALSLVAACGGPDGTTAAQSALAQDDGHQPNTQIFTKDARPFGASLETWAERWVRWVYSIPAATNPFFVPTADNDQNQQGPVFFISNFQTGARTTTVPSGTAIGLPLAFAFNDFPCPDPTFQPAPGQTLFDFLTSFNTPGQDNVAELDATLDGEPLTDLLSFRVASEDLFYFVGDTSLQVFDNCVTGTPQPGVVDAFFIMLKPLEPGAHVLETSTITKSGRVFGPHIANLDVRDGD